MAFTVVFLLAFDHLLEFLTSLLIFYYNHRFLIKIAVYRAFIIQRILRKCKSQQKVPFHKAKDSQVMAHHKRVFKGSLVGSKCKILGAAKKIEWRREAATIMESGLEEAPPRDDYALLYQDINEYNVKVTHNYAMAYIDNVTDEETDHHNKTAEWFFYHAFSLIKPAQIKMPIDTQYTHTGGKNGLIEVGDSPPQKEQESTGRGYVKNASCSPCTVQMLE